MGKRALDFKNVFERLDIFGKPLPSFNIKGRDSVNTMIGGLCTVMLYAIVLLYGITKLIHLE